MSWPNTLKFCMMLYSTMGYFQKHILMFSSGYSYNSGYKYIFKSIFWKISKLLPYFLLPLSSPRTVIKSLIPYLIEIWLSTAESLMPNDVKTCHFSYIIHVWTQTCMRSLSLLNSYFIKEFGDFFVVNVLSW